MHHPGYVIIPGTMYNALWPSCSLLTHTSAHRIYAAQTAASRRQSWLWPCGIRQPQLNTTGCQLASTLYARVARSWRL